MARADMLAAAPWAIVVDCPTCGAAAGVRCVDEGVECRFAVHPARLRAVQEQAQS